MPTNVGHVAHAKSEEEAKALIEKLMGNKDEEHNLPQPLTPSPGRFLCIVFCCNLYYVHGSVTICVLVEATFPTTISTLSVTLENVALMLSSVIENVTSI